MSLPPVETNSISCLIRAAAHPGAAGAAHERERRKKQRGDPFLYLHCITSVKNYAGGEAASALPHALGIAVRPVFLMAAHRALMGYVDILRPQAELPQAHGVRRAEIDHRFAAWAAVEELLRVTAQIFFNGIRHIVVRLEAAAADRRRPSRRICSPAPRRGRTSSLPSRRGYPRPSCASRSAPRQ